MKTKLLKNKVRIELSHSEYHNMVSRLNQLDSVLGTITEMNDLYLSDIGRLYNVKWDLRELLDAEYSSENYKYLPQGEKNE